MKIVVALILSLVALVSHTHAQFITIMPDGGNKRASVSEQIGITKVAIDYGRPGVKGREGKIWGTNVAHYGLRDFGAGKIPWRAGANENTVVSFSDEVEVEGKHLAAGTYGLFMILGEAETTVIFSKNSTSWGSFSYDDSEDALRVTVKNRNLDQSEEWLKYEFTNQTDSSSDISLLWEKRMITFNVKVDLIGTHITSFKRELRSGFGYAFQSYCQAADFCLRNNTNLDLALEWSDKAISGQFVGVRTFQTLALKASILEALGNKKEGYRVMDEAVSLGSLNELHQYARSLQVKREYSKALTVFKLNSERHPNEFIALVGLGRGYSSMGDYKNALKYMKLALPKAPNEQNRNTVIGMIKKLEEGRDAND